MSLGRWLIEAGKELIAVIVQLVAASPPRRTPNPHPRHRVRARPIGERARRADDYATPVDNPRRRADDEGGRH